MTAASEGLLDLRDRRGRLTLVAVTLGSAVGILDGSIVNVALKTIGVALDASLAQLQWVVNGYALSLAGLVLVGGSLGDRLGRRRVYLAGMVVFAVASAVCGFARTPEQLVAARVVQGVGAALATPGALAIIEASFVPVDRARAIGVWAGYSGIASAAGPFVGGWLVDHGGWRWIFFLNLPLVLAVVVLALRYTPESSDPEASRRFDVIGALLSVAGLGLLTYALTRSASPGVVTAAFVLGLAATTAFVVHERRSRRPLVPMSLFSSRVFSAANAMTFLVYGALSGVFLFLVLQLQVSTGLSALAAGAATVPTTILLLVLSPRAAAVSARIGPRLPMSLGPLLCAVGALLLVPVGEGTAYLTGVLPGVVVFSLGLALLVSPLTATVLAAAPDRYAGSASGVNNAVARAGSLLAVAALPALVGLGGDAYAEAAAFTPGYRRALILCAVLLAAGGVVSWFGLAPGRGGAGPAATSPPAGGAPARGG